MEGVNQSMKKGQNKVFCNFLKVSKNLRANVKLA